jgi:hypothetical protein
MAVGLAWGRDDWLGMRGLVGLAGGGKLGRRRVRDVTGGRVINLGELHADPGQSWVGF